MRLEYLIILREVVYAASKEIFQFKKAWLKITVLIRKLLPHLIEIELLSGTLSAILNNHAEKIFLIPQITFEFKPCYAPWTVTRKQFPL